MQDETKIYDMTDAIRPIERKSLSAFMKTITLLAKHNGITLYEEQRN